MQFWVEGNDTLSKATDPAKLHGRVPGFTDSMNAVSDLREQYRQNGTQGWMYDRGWKHVASIRGPVLKVAELLNPEFLNGNGKRDFYAWLDTHPAYLTYDRRAAQAQRPFFGWRADDATSTHSEAADSE